MPWNQESILDEALLLFKEAMDAYSFKLSFRWPFLVSNRKYIQRMQNITLDRLSRMYSKLHELLRKHKIDDHLKSTMWQSAENMMFIQRWELTESSKENYVRDFELIGLKEYASKTLKSNAFSYS